jgi:hypothetical protein
MVQEQRQKRDFSVNASHINFLKSIETARKMAEIYPQNMLWISPEKASSSFFYCCLMYKP